MTSKNGKMEIGSLDILTSECFVTHSQNRVRIYFIKFKVLLISTQHRDYLVESKLTIVIQFFLRLFDSLSSYLESLSKHFGITQITS